MPTDRNTPGSVALDTGRQELLRAGRFSVSVGVIVDDTDQESSETFTVLIGWGDSMPQRYQEATPAEITITIDGND